MLLHRTTIRLLLGSIVYVLQNHKVPILLNNPRVIPLHQNNILVLVLIIIIIASRLTLALSGLLASRCRAGVDR
jgi:hypothetical protein